MQTIFINKPRTPRWVRVVEIGLAAAVLVLMYLFFTSCGCAAATTELRGRIVGVLDGDTLVLLDARNSEVRVRLAEIDAPEKGQDFGQKARERLSSLVFGRHVTAQCSSEDRYGRQICHVYAQGVNVNAEMVRSGHAWVYRKYATDPALYSLEESARAQRLGLWLGPQPTPPWEWRKAAH